jgi:subtilase family serine protease
MSIHKDRSQNRVHVTSLLVILAVVSFGFPKSAKAQVAADNTSRLLSNAENLGAEDLSKQITVTVWLKHHNQGAFDELVREMYDKASPNYHHWLTKEQYMANFAPTARETAAVREFLTTRNLTISSVEENNHFVSAQGRIADVQSAFKVQINRFKINGEIRRANLTEPAIEGPAGSLVASVQGLSDLRYSANVRRPLNPDGGSFRAVPVASASPDGLVFTADCFRAPETVTFTTPGGGPSAVYAGNRYGSDLGTPPPNAPPCGYDPAEMQTAYGLNTVYVNGFAGTGQTIVIVDAFGSNTIMTDTNKFSTLNHLPLLTSKNFHIFRPNGSAHCDPVQCVGGNWDIETTLDVEWAHSIAPAANIALVLGADNSFTNLDIANLFAIDNLLGNVVSNSFGISERALVAFLPSELVVENNLAETAAALGISQNVSSGDSGDNLIADQNDFGIDATSAQSATSSPFVTGVGGTSMFLNTDHTIKFQTGWGLNFVRIADPTPNPPTVPPLFFGFQSGAGGGASVVFAKPSFQSDLPGDFRQTPDISMDADPETGVEIILTDVRAGGKQVIEVIGGTSLSCPMFSGLWAIANQAAGGGPLGQAAPLLYHLPPSAITDVRQIGSANNVKGVISIPNTPPKPSTIIHESAKALAEPLENTTNFVSALFQSSASTRWDVFTFGTDSSLTTGPGWDNVTGVGTPKGLGFINAVVAAASSADGAVAH